MDYKYLFLTKENGIAVVTINRSEGLNALNCEVFSEIYQMFANIEKDLEIRVIILTGSGNKAFIAGADIMEMSNQDSVTIENFIVNGRMALDKIYNINKPVIAAINGYAFGGGNEVALCCDLRIASEKAKFGQLEINLGIVPGGGSIQRLTRLIGMTKAKEIVYTGDIIDAETALKIGFINKVVPHDQLMNEARAMANKLISKSGVTLAYIKKCFNTGADMSLSAGLDLDESYFARCFSTYDQKEGMKAFTEKRNPEFRNK
ncbi:MAG: enoyl-CoA hydratase/isomerase family protein [Syntrophales bacterium]